MPNTVVANQGQDLGPANPETAITVVVVMRSPDAAGLQAQAAAVRSGAPPISASDFLANYAPGATAYIQTVDFLQQQGLSVQTSSNRMLISATGTVAQIDSAFNTRIDAYAVGDRTDYANVEPASLPAVIGGNVLTVVGLDNIARFHTMSHVAAAAPMPPMPATVAQKVYEVFNPPLGLTPLGIWTAYDVTPVYQSVYGTGTTIDIIIWNSMQASDLQAFDSLFGLPNPTLNQISVTGGPLPLNYTTGGSGEATLDVEWSHAMAPGAAIDVYEAPSGAQPDVLMALNEAIAQDAQTHAHVVSMSWGSPDGDLSLPIIAAGGQLFAAGTAEGITFLAASGDHGSTPGLTSSSVTPVQTNNPADDPNVTAVGGTYLTVNADGTYGGETTWNSTEGNDFFLQYQGVTSLHAGGGGFSQFIKAPAWQAPTVSNWTYQSHVYNSGGMRGVPDVSFDAGTAVITVQDSFVYPQEGTSFATPAWAGIVDLIDEGRAVAGLPPIGNLAPVIYGLATSNPSYFYTHLFHDVTMGTNQLFAGSTVTYPAATGWDPATGWGTPIVAALYDQLVGQSSVGASVVAEPAAIGTGYPAGTQIELVGTDTNFQPGMQVTLDVNGVDYVDSVSVQDASHAFITLKAGIPGLSENNVDVASGGQSLSAALFVGAVSASVSPSSLPAGYSSATLTVSASGMDASQGMGFASGSETTAQAVYSTGNSQNFTPATGIIDASSILADGAQAQFSLPSGLGVGQYDLVVEDQNDALTFVAPFSVVTPVYGGGGGGGGFVGGGTVGGGSSGSPASAPATSITTKTLASGAVGTSGGQIATADHSVVLTIPAKAFPQTTQVTVKAVPLAHIATPSDSTLASALWSVSATDGAEPSVGVRGTFSYDPSMVSRSDSGRLGVFALNAATGVWRWIGGVVNTANHTISVVLPHFSLYGVLLNQTRFSDIPAGYWAEGAINRLLGGDLVSGYGDGTFRPNDPITRAQFAKLIAGGMRLPLHPSSSVAFKDVTASSWYAPYVDAVAHAGYMQGYGGSFHPNAPITRQEAAVVLARALRLPETSLPALNFTDRGSIASWAAAAVAADVAHGVLHGYPNHVFAPLSPTTRAEAAAMIAAIIR